MEVTSTTKKLTYVAAAIFAVVIILGLMSAFVPDGSCEAPSSSSQSYEASPF